MPPLEFALACYYSYSLFGRLFQEGLTADGLGVVGQVAELAEAVPAGATPDLLAADFQHLFGFNLFPYESLFVGDEGLLGGRGSEQVAAIYQQSGWTAPQTVPADHIGAELAFLAFLCQQETVAWRLDDPGRVNHWQQQQYHFLQTHLARWIGPLTIAITQQQTPFFINLAHLIMALLNQHYGQLNTASFARPSLLAGYPQSTIALDHEQTTLNDITTYLLTHCYSGFFLSRDVIGQMGQAVGVPAGFGSRHQMLSDLLQMAGHANQLQPLLTTLQEQVNQWQGHYHNWQTNYPHLTLFQTPWQERLTQTSQFLSRLMLDRS